MVILAIDTLTRFSLTVGILVGISGGIIGLIRLGYKMMKAIDGQVTATIRNTEAVHDLSDRMDKFERKRKWRK
jgi:hypothetical protein